MRLPGGSALAALNQSDNATNDADEILASVHVRPLKKSETNGDVQDRRTLNRGPPGHPIETRLLPRRELAGALRDIQRD